MALKKKTKSFLNRPFPGPESAWKELKGIFIASLIVFTFLFVFKPFGMAYYEGSIFLLALSFGAVSFIMSLIYMVFTRFILKIHKDLDTWTLKLWILDLIFMICLITIGNYLFTLYKFENSFSWMGLLNMLLCTVLIAIFPITFFGYRKQIQLERKSIKDASEIAKDLEHHKRETANTKTILAVESMQNYVHIYMDINGEFQKETLRMTLTNALETYSNQGLIKCHRSYLVNTSHIHEVNGNAQGLKLILKSESCPIIPVSRSYIQKVKSALA